MRVVCQAVFIWGLLLSAGLLFADDEDPVQRLEARIEALEAEQVATEKALESERLSENDPDWVMRLKALEFENAGFRAISRRVGALEGIEASIDLSSTLQQVDTGSIDELYHNYRFDASVAVPAGAFGRKEGSLFFHIRAGQSPDYLELPPMFTGLNASAFQLGGTTVPEDSSLTLVEAWYQLDMPLEVPAPGMESKHWLVFNIGKIDPFIFFDQNNYANDESNQFLASTFVHNAILDNPIAAQIGADAYGSTPGTRLAYRYERGGGESYELSAAVFGAGEDAVYADAFSNSFNIFQAQWSTRFWGYAANVRLYRWSNDAGSSFNGSTEKSRGLGVSIDQQLTSNMGLFIRFANGKGEGLPFDKSASVGMEVNGFNGRRGGDKIGIAYARHDASESFKQAAPTLTEYAYTPSYESVVEIYYRCLFNDSFQLTPHLQRVKHPGANQDADEISSLGIRLQWSY